MGAGRPKYLLTGRGEGGGEGEEEDRSVGRGRPKHLLMVRGEGGGEGRGRGGQEHEARAVKVMS